jgi:hypothetical protein
VDLFEYLKKEIIKKAASRGLVLTPEALDYLLYSSKSVDEILDSLALQGLTFVRLEDILNEKKEKVEEKIEKEGDGREEREPTSLEEPRTCEPRLDRKAHV